MTGLLLALEGIDGAGTTTALEPLADALRDLGVSVITTCEPSGGSVGQLIRRVLRQEESMDEASLALLFAADRLDHLRRVILPALNAGTWVLTDRYLLSSYAYQTSPALSEAWIQSINQRAPKADVSFYFRVSFETAHARRTQRGGKAERFDAEVLQRHVLQMYEDLCQQGETSQEMISVDAEKSAVDVLGETTQVLRRLVKEHRDKTGKKRLVDRGE